MAFIEGQKGNSDIEASLNNLEKRELILLTLSDYCGKSMTFLKQSVGWINLFALPGPIFPAPREAGAPPHSPPPHFFTHEGSPGDGKDQSFNFSRGFLGCLTRAGRSVPIQWCFSNNNSLLCRCPAQIKTMLEPMEARKFINGFEGNCRFMECNFTYG